MRRAHRLKTVVFGRIDLKVKYLYLKKYLFITL